MLNQIISMTTIPSRINEIEYAVESLKKQNLPVYIFIPEYFKRKGVKFDGKIPPFMKHKNIYIETVDDCGPITKLIYALDIANTIITVDDDNIYEKDFAKNLLNYHEKYPGEALCSTGVILRRMSYIKSSKIKNINKKVDIVLGCQGALYDSNFFNDYIYEYQNNPPAYYVDDIWISGNLATNGVDRRCVPAGVTYIDKNVKFVDNLAVTNKKNRNNNKLIRKFKNQW